MGTSGLRELRAPGLRWESSWAVGGNWEYWCRGYWAGAGGIEKRMAVQGWEVEGLRVQRRLVVVTAVLD